MQSLDSLKKEVLLCKKCKLSGTRTTVVFGEGPGKQEDLQARPFVGRSGELLTRIIENGMGIPRAEVFIANIVKCRPTVDLKFTKDRAPDREETAMCSPWLERQIEMIAPKVIVTLGGPSAKFILKTEEGITKLRGKWGDYQGIRVMPTFHPSYILRNGGDKSPLKKDVWSDIKQVMQYLGW